MATKVNLGSCWARQWIYTAGFLQHFLNWFDDKWPAEEWEWRQGTDALASPLFLSVLRYFIILIFFVCVNVESSHEYRYRGVQKSILDPLELELQPVLSHLVWALGTELQSSARAVYVPNFWAPLCFNPHFVADDDLEHLVFLPLPPVCWSSRPPGHVQRWRLSPELLEC